MAALALRQKRGDAEPFTATLIREDEDAWVVGPITYMDERGSHHKQDVVRLPKDDYVVLRRYD